MPADRILVIDAGTSALRALLVDAQGAVTNVASHPWPMFVPEDAAPFGREFDGVALAGALRSVVAAHGVNVAAIATTGQREGLVFVDDCGAALCVSPNIDARAATQGMAIDAVRAPEVYRTTGHLPSLMQAPAKFAWLRDRRPEVAARVRAILPLADWLGALAGGDGGMSRALAAENGLLDVSTREPCIGLLDRGGVPAVQVVAIQRELECSGDRVPVVLAGGDTQCALVGMGAINGGDVGVPAGWSAPVQMVTAAPIFDGDMRTWTSVHAIPERWILESNAGETGRAWDWICTMLGVTVEEADALASAAPPGSADVMTVLGPRAMNAAAMNAGVGAITLPMPLVMSAPERGHLLRSLLEATAYAIRANLEQLEQVTGAQVARLGVGGGMSRSAAFMQIVADLIDRPVEVAASAETSSLGAAAIASVAIGRHASLSGAVDAMCGRPRLVEPDARASAAYEDHYARWCSMADETLRLATL